jgi:hypothetical protein
MAALEALEPLTRVLIGFVPPSEIEKYLQTTMQIDARKIDLSKFVAVHALAYAHASNLKARPESVVTSLGEHPHLSALRAEPTFQEFASGGPVDLVKVDLRKLRVGQPRVEWPHVERLMRAAPEVGDEAALLDFCLPLQKTMPAEAALQSSFSRTTQTLSFITDNPDFRIGGPVVDNLGNGRALLGFWLSPGQRQMSVAGFDGRYVVRNGHHRAVALALRGHLEVPVLLTRGVEQQASRPGMFPPDLVLGDAGPRVEDFLGPAAIDLPRRRTRTLYSIQAATHAIVD